MPEPTETKTRVQQAADTLLEHIVAVSMQDRLGEEKAGSFIEELIRISEGAEYVQ